MSPIPSLYGPTRVFNNAGRRAALMMLPFDQYC